MLIVELILFLKLLNITLAFPFNDHKFFNNSFLEIILLFDKLIKV